MRVLWEHSISDSYEIDPSRTVLALASSALASIGILSAEAVVCEVARILRHSLSGPQVGVEEQEDDIFSF